MRRNYFFGFIAVLVISFLVLYWDLSQTNFNALLASSKNINYGFIILILLVILCTYFCEAAILFVLSGKQKFIDLLHFYRVPLIQALFNAITPMATGGQPAQLIALKQMKIEFGPASSLLLMKFIIYQLVVFFAYIWAFLTGHQLLGEMKHFNIIIVISFLIHMSTIIFLLFGMFARNLLKKIGAFIFKLGIRFISAEKVANFQTAFDQQVDEYYCESQRLFQHKKRLIISFILTCIQLTLFYSVPFLTIKALNLSGSWLELVQLNILVVLFMAIVPIPGASGGAELGFQALFKFFVKNNAQLVMGMFIWRFATYFFGMLLGVIAWLIRPKKEN
ncbi:lysylphosphatidylglycerol synthase transmembrane domain-containing protein [Lactobacillus mulieris]|jgi:hypothetical protein|uniref:Phosphatidylglycerol lysyltransferase n=1 Tax=Lactobacillus mulieris TaxID=2508708 RepID=A0AAP3M3Y1_9LACO|nr:MULTISPECIES: lysylphosphatidylglycerol synthase transmembrane domain-containing protein [Lactobacillus]EEU21071.1 hypothetical protein HMPREF0525_00005 [Lactobacillus jensenii 27-2-CHN]EEX23945.1 hypothetical protein HMPREF0974_00533 [Lactobacillus jensenii 115-3-CHN]EFH29118.1 hypothetical protein HMPREF0526_10721 [Lactobacillus jensenii JV-V16]KAA9244389.1 flippase-like domain-containing protein [Lactobacillus jensenii]KAA9369412.1 flippase-like domain-containing protein [Lactobacillus j